MQEFPNLQCSFRHLPFWEHSLYKEEKQFEYPLAGHSTNGSINVFTVVGGRSIVGSR
jgi:hypothetical protein